MQFSRLKPAENIGQRRLTHYEFIKKKLVAEGTFPSMINMGVRMRLDAHLEEQAGVLPFEEWRKLHQ